MEGKRENESFPSHSLSFAPVTTPFLPFTRSEIQAKLRDSLFKRCTTKTTSIYYSRSSPCLFSTHSRTSSSNISENPKISSVGVQCHIETKAEIPNMNDSSQDSCMYWLNNPLRVRTENIYVARGLGSAALPKCQTLYHRQKFLKFDSTVPYTNPPSPREHPQSWGVV